MYDVISLSNVVDLQCTSRNLLINALGLFQKFDSHDVAKNIHILKSPVMKIFLQLQVIFIDVPKCIQ